MSLIPSASVLGIPQIRTIDSQLMDLLVRTESAMKMAFLFPDETELYLERDTPFYDCLIELREVIEKEKADAIESQREESLAREEVAS